MRPPGPLVWRNGPGPGGCCAAVLRPSSLHHLSPSAALRRSAHHDDLPRLGVKQRRHPGLFLRCVVRTLVAPTHPQPPARAPFCVGTMPPPPRPSMEAEASLGGSGPGVMVVPLWSTQWHDADFVGRGGGGLISRGEGVGAMLHLGMPPLRRRGPQWGEVSRKCKNIFIINICICLKTWGGGVIGLFRWF